MSKKKALGPIAAILALIMLALPSCNKKEIGDTKAKDSLGIHRIFERGPVTVKIDIDKEEMTIADRLNLAISVTAAEDFEIELPGFGEKLEQFGIVDYYTTQPKLVDDNKKMITRSYVLEPFLSGDYTIPSMKVRFWERGKEETEQHEVETSEIIIKVKSLLPETIGEKKLHDIKPPVRYPVSYAIWIWSGSIACIVAAVSIAVFIFVRKRKQAMTGKVISKIPAHELAFDRLEKLVSENLIEKGEIKRFYEGISDILRRYIENRFSINAPDQTTEEFLAGLKTREDFPDNYQLLLKAFLTHCDLVKFAEHQPETTDIENTFESCKEFIMGTKEEKE